MKKIQGRLKSFGFHTTQGKWTFDVSAITRAADAQPVAGADAQPQPSTPPQRLGGRDANLAKNNSKPPTRSGQQLHTESSCARDLPQSDDNDDDNAFMEPPPRQPVVKKQCINATSKVQYLPRIPSSMLMHILFDVRHQHLTQRLESKELLKFLFDRLDPKTMVLNVTKDKGIHVTPLVLKQVFDLLEGGEDIDLHTHIQASKALSTFRTLLGLEESHDLHASHLQKTLKDDLDLGSSTITDDMAIRFLFIIACNKLLFPSTDKNIRCKDVYLTRDLSCLPALNSCKAVVDDLREAALTWQADKAKKSFSLRNNIDTCYHTTQNLSSNTPPSIEPLATTSFPSMQAELRGLVDQISGEPRKTQAMLALASFDAKAKKASSYVTIGQQMLSDAHQAATRTLQAILNDEMDGNDSEDHDNQPHASQANDVDMYDGQNAQNVGPEYVLGAPPCTQDEIIHRLAIAPRPQRLTKRLARYVSSFKGDPQRAKAPQLTAHAVRKKFHIAMKCKSDTFIRIGLREFSGSDISESFLDGEMLSTQFMSYFIACMSYDGCHMADGGGYRVFLSQELGFLLPVMEEHYSIYYIYLILLATDFEMKQFTRFKRPIIDVCMHTHDNDC
uniref:Uncharacterized protein n=1 Tax=Setaria italica TaxID=4555 RepID=K3YCC0_SETIT